MSSAAKNPFIDSFLVGTSVLKSFAQVQAGQASVDALRLQQTQERLSATNQTLQRMNKLQQIVSSQNAAAAARGITPDSGSFSALQQDTFNQAARDQKIADLNESAKEAELSQDINNVEAQTRFGVLSNLFDLGEDFALGKDSSFLE